MEKNKIKIFVIILLAAVIIFGIIFAFINARNNPGADSPEDFSKVTSIKINDTAFNVELADNDEERARGLSGRAALANDKGMLFIFDQSLPWGFWMKDMNFPIDIVWIGDDFKIVHIENSVLPETFPESFAPVLPARFVLEINAGLMNAYKIEVGDEVVFSHEK